jgi:hypothetical protein
MVKTETMPSDLQIIMKMTTCTNLLPYIFLVERLGWVLLGRRLVWRLGCIYIVRSMVGRLCCILLVGRLDQQSCPLPPLPSAMET